MSGFKFIPNWTDWKGLTRDNHISMLFGNNKQKASDIMVQLQAYKYGNSFESDLRALPTKEFESDDEFWWDVIGSSRRNVPLIEARRADGSVVTAGGENVGANTEPFYLVFGKDWFADGEYIVGELNEIYQFRILEDARMEGTNAVYKVELGAGNIDGVPVERLLSGERFSIEAAFVEAEMSREVGDARFAAPVSMRNEFSHVRIHHKVPGNKLNKQVVMQIPIVTSDGSKRTVNTWMHLVDWAVEQQFSDYKNNALAFGRSNRNPNGEYTNVGKSGGIIKTGDGLFAQIEASNTYYYNDFSLKLLENAIYNLTYGRRDFKNRTYVLRTGELGAIQFHKAIQKEASGWNMFTINGDAVGVIQRTNSPLHENALRAGYQFVEYLAPNGVTLKLEVEHGYDDQVRNKIQHPNGGPAFSYRYDILDLGDGQEPNIFRCKVKGQEELRGYQWGPFRNPFTGQTDNMSASFDEDAAVIHKIATLGVCVLDPTRTMSIIPNVLH